MGWFDWLKGNKQPAQTPAAPTEEFATRADDDPAYERSFDARASFLAQLGRVDDDVLSHIISPELLGAPAWPTTRQAFRVVRTTDSLIITTDGLSDPFRREPDNDVQGFGMEVFVDVVGAQDWSQDDIMSSKPFHLVRSMANTVAGHGQIAEILERLGLLSIELEVPDGLDDMWLSPNGVGALLGMKSTYPTMIDGLPFGLVHFVPITPLTASETAQAAVDQASKEQLRQTLIENGIGHKTDFARGSVV